MFDADRRQTTLGDDDDIWTELIGIRNVYAHYTPSAISYDRVWFDAANDIDRVLADVRHGSQAE